MLAMDGMYALYLSFSAFLNFISFVYLRTFETIIDRSRYDLQQAIVATSGVTIFVPIDTAFRNLPLNTNLMSNQSLINRVCNVIQMQN